MNLLTLALWANFIITNTFINTAWLHIELKRTFNNYEKTISILINKEVTINTGTTEGVKWFVKGSYYCEGLQKRRSQLEFCK